MTDKEFERTKKRVVRLVSYWVKTLGLGYWRGKNLWCDEGLFAADGSTDKEIRASVSVQWEYMDYSIQWNCPVLSELNDEELELTVLHELCHVLLAELQYEKAHCHVERVTTTLQKAFLWVRATGRREGKKR